MGTNEDVDNCGELCCYDIAGSNDHAYYYRLLRQMAAQKKYNYIHKIQKYIHKTEHKNRLQAKITVHTLLKNRCVHKMSP